MPLLNMYFQIHQLTFNALDRYLVFASSRRWNIDGPLGKLHLYAQAAHAFDPEISYSEALVSFRLVYDTFRNWPGVNRLGKFAPAEDVFDFLLNYGSSFFYETGINLANLNYPSREATCLESFLPALKFVKSTKQYPWMPVSKVLHFANPGLFPMWDNDIIWDKVMRNKRIEKPAAFHSEYQEFCRENRFSIHENGPKFNLNYTLWAARYIQQSNPNLMGCFKEWMIQHFITDVSKYRLGLSLPTYYATAFEYIAIGAAYLEMDRIKGEQS